MSSNGTRTRYTFQSVPGQLVYTPATWEKQYGLKALPPLPTVSVQSGKQITVSESHPRDRHDGSYREGGPFYTSRVTNHIKAGHVGNAYNQSQQKLYTGPIYGPFPSPLEQKEVGFSNTEGLFGDKNESQMTSDGATAISLSNPINPASNLGTSLAEAFREGIPSLPGIQLWENKTHFLKDLGSEYLNYQFGWAPLKDEVSSVVNAARNHRDLLQQYHRGEGSDTHRRFEFPTQVTKNSKDFRPSESQWHIPWEIPNNVATRRVSLVRETKKWFEGCFTYGLPSSTDSWQRSLGFGSDADQLYGLALSPDVLWELTPWSWAVDWFSNAGDVINNVTNFGLAGLVMRYGYMMEESIETVTAEGICPEIRVLEYPGKLIDHQVPCGSYACSIECVTKRRIPANPFGFGIGWEDLSPTQLAITAALGITRLL